MELDTTVHGLTELRVHGVSGTPPEQMLAHPAELIKRVAGASKAGFWRRWYPGGTTDDQPDIAPSTSGTADSLARPSTAVAPAATTSVNLALGCRHLYQTRRRRGVGRIAGALDHPDVDDIAIAMTDLRIWWRKQCVGGPVARRGWDPSPHRGLDCGRAARVSAPSQ